MMTGVGHLVGDDNGVDWPAGVSNLKPVASPVAGENGTAGCLSLRLNRPLPSPGAVTALGALPCCTWL